MKHFPKVWMNGKFVMFADAKVHLLCHSLHYGNAIFEGIRCYNTEKGSAVFRLREHLNRFFNSAKAYMMNIPYSKEELRKATLDLIKVNKIKECYIRPIAFYGSEHIGLETEGLSVNVAIIPVVFGRYFKDKIEKGVRVKISSWCRINPLIVPPQAKCSGNYANSLLAKIEALRSGYDEAIMQNISGYVAEGSGENVFIVRQGKLITPPVHAGILIGVTRDSVMRIAKDMGIEVIIRDIPREELYIADEAFFTGTAAEVTPIVEVDDRKIGDGRRGKITEKIQKKFFEIVQGKDERYHEWLEFAY
ncbi:MAG: branched-chain amino acid transaminase [Candidatus Micrarchaeia archaeon]